MSEDNDIVNIDQTSVTQMAAQDTVHQSFERSRCIAETKRHDFKLEQAILSNECGFRSRILTKGHLSIPRRQIEGTEVLRTSHRIEGIVNVRQGV